MGTHKLLSHTAAILCALQWLAYEFSGTTPNANETAKTACCPLMPKADVIAPGHAGKATVCLRVCALHLISRNLPTAPLTGGCSFLLLGGHPVPITHCMQTNAKRAHWGGMMELLLFSASKSATRAAFAARLESRTEKQHVSVAQ